MIDYFPIQDTLATGNITSLIMQMFMLYFFLLFFLFGQFTIIHDTNCYHVSYRLSILFTFANIFLFALPFSRSLTFFLRTLVIILLFFRKIFYCC